MGVIAIYEDPAEVERAILRRLDAPVGDGQLLYRDGQRWIGAIAAVAPDRFTNSDIDDQRFMRRVAELLDTDFVEC